MLGQLRNLRVAAVAAPAGLALAAALYVLVSGGHGLDLTDESFYLLSIENPWAYTATTSQFGLVYHPLYSVCGGDLACMRSFNVSATFLLSLLLMSFLLIGRFRAATWCDRVLVGLLGITFSSASLLSFWLRLITPSYNGLNLQALLIVSIALLGSVRYPDRRLLWPLLIGVGGASCFLAKPTSAALLAPITGLVWLVMHPRPIGSIAVASGAALTCLAGAAYFLDGSLHGFAERLTTGMEFAQSLGGGYGWSELLQFNRPPLGLVELGGLALAALLMAAVGRLIGAPSSTARDLVEACVVLAVVAVVVWLIYRPGDAVDGVSHHELFVRLLPLSFATGLVLSNIGSVRTTITKQTVALGAFFFALPFVYAFGTNGNNWHSAAQATIFWTAGAVTLLRVTSENHSRATTGLGTLIPAAAATAIITAIVSVVWIKQPYRQSEGVYQQVVRTTVGIARKPVRTSIETNRYFRQLRLAAAAGDFEAGNPVIDLTGLSPGAVLAIEGRGVVEAWLPGGYTGQASYVERVFSVMSCADRERTFVLVEPRGPRSIGWPDALRPVTDYAVAGVAIRPATPENRAGQQILLRPKRVAPQMACAASARS